MRRWTTLLLLGAAGAFLAVPPAVSALEIGQPGPAWKGLIGVDDKPHSLSDLKTAKVVVVCFTCNHCPIARLYEDRLIQFVKDYKNKGVALVAINVNNIPADRLPNMKIRAEEKRFNFPYLYDPTQEIGRRYGATCTPHVFVLDGNRELAYKGAIDDSNNPSAVKDRYLRKAVDAVLAGRAPETTSTRQRGCSIKYEAK